MEIPGEGVGGVSLYMVQFDGQPDYVEAESFAKAIDIWRANLVKENPPYSDFETQEPESVSLLTEAPVLR